MNIYQNNIKITESMKNNIKAMTNKIDSNYNIGDQLNVHVTLDKSSKNFTVETLINSRSNPAFSKKVNKDFHLACKACFTALTHQLEKRKNKANNAGNGNNKLLIDDTLPNNELLSDFEHNMILSSL